jgi:hypothetical protein
MRYKLPCRTQRRLDAGLNLRLVVTTNVVILGAGDDDEALYTPQRMSVADISVILDRCRPSNNKDLPTDQSPPPPPCDHPESAQIEDCGQVVCTLCGLCTGCVYERPVFILPNSGITIQRKHYYRPEAYLKTHIKRLGRGISQRFANRLHQIWPYICKIFRRLAVEDAVINKRTRVRKNMLSYPYVIERLLFRWGVDTTKLNIKPMKTVSRRREANRLWALLEPRLPDHL